MKNSILYNGGMMRFFNTAGPVKCDNHYCLPPLERFDLDEVISLIDQQKYFVLHAPRQTGKTSYLLALMKYLNQSGKYKALYINVEAAQAARENVRAGIKAILSELGSRARIYLKDDFPNKIWHDVSEQSGEHGALNEVLTLWSEKSPEPLVLFIDEIDSLIGDTLISVLRQIRAGYDKRPSDFPQSIILCGIRDVRDYRIHSDRDKAVITGGSAFNVKVKSLRLGNFTRQEVLTLLNQHVHETGQIFEPEAENLIWEYTQGQPWLVNALAYEACFEIKANRDRTKAITGDMIAEAKETLIIRRDTHLDQLADKLKEERVRQVIAPLLLGTSMEGISTDNIQYLTDLGLIRRTASGLEIANPIYREIIPRELTVVTQCNMEPAFTTTWYVMPDGRLDMTKLIAAFQEFFRENSEHWIERFDYKEAGPQLLLQAFLQRIINSGGRIEREYGLGRGRTDLLAIWRHPGGVQKAVIELKILHKSLEKTIAEGLRQTAEYADRCGSNEAHLIIFDRRADKTWEEKIFLKTESFEGKNIKIWGM